MDFSGGHVASIEAALDAQRPGGWRRASQPELAKYSRLMPRAAWRLEVPQGQVTCPGISYFLAMIDTAFPWSEPKIIVPQAPDDFSWPHVEGGGVLCLGATRSEAAAGARVLAQLISACKILCYTEDERRAEFSREFAAYWNQRLSTKPPQLRFFSLLNPRGPSREVRVYGDWLNSAIIVGEEAPSLLEWLHHTGRNVGEKQIARSWLTWLENPLTPAQFPESGADVLDSVPEPERGRLLKQGDRIPMVIGVETPTGPALVGVVLKGGNSRELTKGFRDIRHVPDRIVYQSFAARPVQRCALSRADGGWVHGRDHDAEFASLASKSVLVVGCGALGAPVARLLVQAGVGRLVLVDPDDLATHNTSRHVLGNHFVGRNKAASLATTLRRDFPHLREIVEMRDRFERLTSRQLETIGPIDLVVSAGLALPGDAQIDVWRRSLELLPPHVCAWVEAYAMVGHAVALFGLDSLMDGFCADGNFRFRLTDWPDQAHAVIAEAGCGNVFQPHGAIDLQASVTLASRLALSVLNGEVVASCRRTWQGSRDAVVKLGGTPLDLFTESCVAKSSQWP